MTKQRTAECDTCGTVKSVRAMYAIDVYDTPWDDQPHTIYTCKHTPKEFKAHYHYSWMESCEELLTDSSWADFRYFMCEDCGRMICEQNPRNGWHVQYRIVNDCEQVCLSCYQKRLIEDGTDEDSLKDGKLPGMFLDESDVAAAGYIKVIDDQHITGTESARRICDAGLKYIQDGHKVIVGYESMAIGGLEGYVSLWIK